MLLSVEAVLLSVPYLGFVMGSGCGTARLVVVAFMERKQRLQGKPRSIYSWKKQRATVNHFKVSGSD